MRTGSEYKRFIAFGDYYSFCKEECDSVNSMDVEVKDSTLKTLFLQRADLLSKFCSSFGTDNNNPNMVDYYHQMVIQIKEIENKIEEVGDELLDTGFYHPLDRQQEFKQTGENQYICSNCGKELNSEQVEKMFGLFNEDCSKNGIGHAMEHYSGLCPFCNTSNGVHYSNVYCVKAELLNHEREKAIDNDDYDRAYDICNQIIEELTQIDPYYKDLKEEADTEIVESLMTMVRIKNSAQDFVGTDQLCNRAFPLFNDAGKHYPSDRISYYMLCLCAKVRDSNAVKYKEANEIKSILDKMIEFKDISIDFFGEHYPELLEQNTRECEVYILEGFKYGLILLEEMHTSEDFMDNIANEVISIVSNSSVLDESEKVEYYDFFSPSPVVEDENINRSNNEKKGVFNLLRNLFR